MEAAILESKLTDSIYLEIPLNSMNWPSDSKCIKNRKKFHPQDSSLFIIELIAREPSCSNLHKLYSVCVSPNIYWADRA